MGEFGKRVTFCVGANVTSGCSVAHVMLCSGACIHPPLLHKGITGYVHVCVCVSSHDQLRSDGLLLLLKETIEFAHLCRRFGKNPLLLYHYLHALCTRPPLLNPRGRPPDLFLLFKSHTAEALRGHLQICTFSRLISDMHRRDISLL